MIKAAIFDMDGLLIDSEPLWYEALRQALLTVSVKHTKENHNKILGQGIPKAVDDLYHMHPWQGASRRQIVGRTIEDFIKLIKTKGEAKPGVYEVLKLLKKQSITMALASSSPYEVIDTIVDRLKIRDYFKVIYSGEDEKHSKPHPAVFITTGEKLKVEPRYCLVFEDSPNGVLAAKAAHMKCVAVPEPELKDHKFIQTADFVLDSLEEFDESMLLR